MESNRSTIAGILDITAGIFGLVGAIPLLVLLPAIFFLPRRARPPELLQGRLKDVSWGLLCLTASFLAAFLHSVPPARSQEFRSLRGSRRRDSSNVDRELRNRGAGWRTLGSRPPLGTTYDATFHRAGEAFSVGTGTKEVGSRRGDVLPGLELAPHRIPGLP